MPALNCFLKLSISCASSSAVIKQKFTKDYVIIGEYFGNSFNDVIATYGFSPMTSLVFRIPITVSSTENIRKLSFFLELWPEDFGHTRGSTWVISVVCCMAIYTRCTNAKTTRKPNSRPNRKLLPENILSVLSPKSNPLLEHYSAACARESSQDIKKYLTSKFECHLCFSSGMCIKPHRPDFCVDICIGGNWRRNPILYLSLEILM